MALWEYKVISSGKGGFATPALLEAYLNQLGKDEWEIIEFRTPPDNPLAFAGLARRPTQREWTLEQAAAAAAKAEAEKLRAEFEEKFKAGTTGSASSPANGDEKPTSLAAEAASADDGLRKLRDTDRDNDPEALADEAAGTDDWDNWEESADDLPTFFEAIKPHLRKNQRGVGQSVAIDYLAKRWEQPERDIVGALQECGFVLPETEEAEPDYLEFEGDLYWLNRNARGQIFLNTREKPRPKFRVTQGRKLDPNDPVAVELAAERAAERQRAEARAQQQQQARAPKAENGAPAPAESAATPPAGEEGAAAPEVMPSEGQPAAPEARATDERPAQKSRAENTGGPLPAGEALLARIRPMMRRNRRGPGFSGSTGYLAKALKQPEADLVAALAALGLQMPEKSGDKPVYTEIGNLVYWLNKDGRGGIWINGRERRDRPADTGGQKSEAVAAAERAAEGAAPDEASPEQAEVASAAPAETPGAVTDGGAPATDVPQIVPEVLTPAAGDNAPAEATPETVPVPVSEVAPEPAAVEPTPEIPSVPSPVGEAVETAPLQTEMPDVQPTPETGEPTLASLRLQLKANKRGGGASGELGALAATLGKNADELRAALVAAGLEVPGDAEAKPVYVEHGDEVLWLNVSPKDGALWLNAKSKSARKSGATRSRSRKKVAEGETGEVAESTESTAPFDVPERTEEGEE